MSDDLTRARAKLAAGDFTLSPAEMQALAVWSATGAAPKAGKPKLLPALIEQVLDICQPADREAARGALAKLFENRVQVVIEKTWTQADFDNIRTGA